MALFSSRKNRKSNAAVVEAERRSESIEAGRLESEGRYFDAIDLLTEANRIERDPRIERELRTLRHRAGIELLENSPENPQYPEPATGSPARGEQSRCPEVTPDQLTPEIVRAAFLEAGCLLVRDVLDDDKALRLAGRVIEFDPDVRGGDGYAIARDILDSGRALTKMNNIIQAQGSHSFDHNHPDLGALTFEVRATQAGVVAGIDNLQLSHLKKGSLTWRWILLIERFKRICPTCSGLHFPDPFQRFLAVPFRPERFTLLAAN